MPALILSYPRDNKSKIRVFVCLFKNHNFWHTRKITTASMQQKICSLKQTPARKHQLGQVRSSFLLYKTTCFKTCYILAIFPPKTLNIISPWFSPTISSSTFWNKSFLEDGPTNKLNYFCYATTNGEKARSPRWTII
jgi:hypothetical protein